MRLAALFVLAVSSSAFAQPGAPPPPPPGYPPPPHTYVPAAHYPAMMSPEEHQLLLDGEITDGQHFGGVVANVFVGYGTGQAIQGRWSDTGWIFTLGETVSTVAFVYGLVEVFDGCTRSVDCDDDNGAGPLIAGVIGMTVFRTWSIIDAARGPGEHNRKLRALKYRLGIPVQVAAPYVRTTSDGTTAGLTLRF